MINPINLVIFSSRESIATLSSSLLSATQAAPAGTRIDILVNGNKELADQIYHWQKHNIEEDEFKIKVWYIPFADKGNAWNQHIHHIWQGDLDAVYIDGYVQVRNNSITPLSQTLKQNTYSLGTCGMPTVGLSAKKLQDEMKIKGGFHGNLCAIKSEALQKIKDRNINIPLGIYRVDGLMGAFLSFGLDNTLHPWNPHYFVPLTTDATWVCDEKKWYRPKDLLAWKKRRDRQARGDIENAAIKYHLTKLKCSFEALPKDVASLVAVWTETCPEEARSMTNQSSRHRKAMFFIRNFISPDQSECIAYPIS